MGRRPKQRCSDCEHWQPGDEWHSTRLPNFLAISEGTCKVSGKLKANCNYRCLKDFKLKTKKGFIIYEKQVKIN